MNHPARFPLLRLPQIAIKEVLSKMTPFELLNISKASSTCRLIVKSFSKNRIRKNYTVVVQMAESIVALQQNSIYFAWVMTDDVGKDGSQCSYNTSDEHYEYAYVYCNGKWLMVKLMEFFLEVKQVFNVGIDNFSFSLCQYRSLHQTILYWLHANFQTVGNVSVYCDNESVTDLEQILNSLTLTKSVQIIGDTIEESAFRIPEHFGRVTIEHGNWIKLEHFMSFKASIIVIKYSTLTNRDLNQFLKSWVNMECHRTLKYVEVNLVEPNTFLTALEDVPHTFESPKKVAFRDPQYDQVNEGVDIIRKDGFVASIFVYQVRNTFVMVMTTPLTASGDQPEFL